MQEAARTAAAGIMTVVVGAAPLSAAGDKQGVYTYRYDRWFEVVLQQKVETEDSNRREYM
jgi:hypothetical protein